MNIKGAASTLRRKGPSLIFAATVATTLPAVVAAKFNPNVPLFPDKYVYLLSRFLGPDLTRKVVGPTYGGNFTPAITATGSGLQPFGWANGTTFAGGLALIIDYAIREIGIVPRYGMFSPFIKAVGGGLILSGVVGGILDPPAGTSSSSARTSSSSARSFAGSGPSGYAHASSGATY